MNKEKNNSQDTETRILQAAEKEFFEKDMPEQGQPRLRKRPV